MQTDNQTAQTTPTVPPPSTTVEPVITDHTDPASSNPAATSTPSVVETSTQSGAPTQNSNVTLKCLVCGYEGSEGVCPKDKMLMEETCPKCKRCKSDCICELSKDSNTPNNP